MGNGVPACVKLHSQTPANVALWPASITRIVCLANTPRFRDSWRMRCRTRINPHASQCLACTPSLRPGRRHNRVDMISRSRGIVERCQESACQRKCSHMDRRVARLDLTCHKDTFVTSFLTCEIHLASRLGRECIMTSARSSEIICS